MDDCSGRQARLQTLVENLAAQLDSALARIQVLEQQMRAFEDSTLRQHTLINPFLARSLGGQTP